MKKSNLFVFLIAILILLQFSGCSLIPSRSQTLTTEIRDMKKSNMAISEAILDCLTAKDAANFLKLFSVRTQELPDTERQIMESFDFFQGNVVSFDPYVMGFEGTTSSRMQTKLLEREWRIKDIVTDAGHTYEISVSTFVICDADKTRVGINNLKIVALDEDKTLNIGYYWPFRYKEGRDLSAKIVKAFDRQEFGALASRFCDLIRAEASFEEEVREALGFFEGRPTYGKTTNWFGQTYTDGKLDYHSTVTEEEVVVDSVLRQSYIPVQITNLMTDTGRVYQIDYFACLIDEDNSSRKGIWKLTITDENGNSHTIGRFLDR